MKAKELPMKSQSNARRQPLAESKPKLSRRSSVHNWRDLLGLRRQRHDPMLVLSMSIFNTDNAWNRVCNPNPSHENGA